MKTSKFQQDIGGTVACTKIISRVTKFCGQMSSNGTCVIIDILVQLKQIRRQATRGWIVVCLLRKFTRNFAYIHWKHQQNSGREGLILL